MKHDKQRVCIMMVQVWTTQPLNIGNSTTSDFIGLITGTTFKLNPPWLKKLAYQLTTEFCSLQPLRHVDACTSILLLTTNSPLLCHKGSGIHLEFLASDNNPDQMTNLEQDEFIKKGSCY